MTAMSFLKLLSYVEYVSSAKPFQLRLLSNHTLRNHLLVSTMPAPSRSSSKRKIECDEDSDPEVGISQSSQVSKKIRKEKSFASENSQPTNKVLPAQIVLPEKLSGTSRIVTWNVSGFAASMKKVSTRFFSRNLAHQISPGLQTLPGSRGSRHSYHYRNKGMPNRNLSLLCALKNMRTDTISYLTQLQQPPADPSLRTRFPHQYWSSSATKGYGKSPFFFFFALVMTFHISYLVVT